LSRRINFDQSIVIDELQGLLLCAFTGPAAAAN